MDRSYHQAFIAHKRRRGADPRAIVESSLDYNTKNGS